MKKSCNFVLVLTACIKPDDKVKGYLKDPEVRLAHYVDALRKYITRQETERIVFCDNSNYEWDSSELNELALRHGKQLEILSFMVDRSKTPEKGASYEFFEMLKYIMLNSRLIRADDYMIEAAGRYYIKNLKSILKHINNNSEYNHVNMTSLRALAKISIKNIKRINTFEIQSMFMPVSVYKEYFMDSSERVDDSVKFYSEHELYNVIIQNKIPYRITFPQPIYDVPFGGTEGYVYKYSFIEEAVKNALALYYNTFKLK